ncbi:MAG: hypothetical protein M5U09_22705 [Gammaproteobacteria bacterium]|nr:hypothetical protein [Gammaproteobacteria bacterium]
MGGSARVTGVFGVFYTGFAQIVFLDAAGHEVSRTNPVDVSPLQPYRLDTVVDLPDGATQAKLMITDSRRVDVAALGQVGITNFQPTASAELVEVPEPAAPAAATVPDLNLKPGGAAPVSTPMPAAGQVPAGKLSENEPGADGTAEGQRTVGGSGD